MECHVEVVHGESTGMAGEYISVRQQMSSLKPDELERKGFLKNTMFAVDLGASARASRAALPDHRDPKLPNEVMRIHRNQNPPIPSPLQQVSPRHCTAFKNSRITSAGREKLPWHMNESC